MEKDFYGYDSLTNERIFTYGSLKRKIKNNIEVKRGNEKLLIEDIKAQIEAITGKEPFIYEGGSHIVFAESAEKSIGGEYYRIEWHYANNKEENIVKKVCKELNITQRELAEIIKVNSGTPAQWITKGEVPPTYQYLLELMIENKTLKEKISKLQAFKDLLNEI